MSAHSRHSSPAPARPSGRRTRKPQALPAPDADRSARMPRETGQVPARAARSAAAARLRRGAPLDDLWPQRHRPAAREELVRRFLPLARRLASRYRNPNEPGDDLVQIASLGLLGAIDRFDPGRGGSFPSFAIPTILGELKRHFRTTGWAAHVPRGAQEMSMHVSEAIRVLTAETGRSPRVSALAEHLGVDIEDVLLGLDAGAAHYASSLDAPMPGSGLPDPVTLGESLGGDDDRLDLVEAIASLPVVISQLPHLERRALTLRMEGELKQVEIALIMGCSQMQVSRLLRQAAAHASALMDPVPAT